MDSLSFQHTSIRLRRVFTSFMKWRRHNIPDTAFLFIVATATGLLAGTGAFILKRMIAGVSHLLTGHLHTDSANWALLLIPVAGIVLTGMFCRYVLHHNLAHGVKQLMKSLSKKVYRLRPDLTFTPMLASTLTLGFGGSAGSEGPIAYTGAAIGSNMGRLFRFSPRMMSIMVGCGAGAGIAGIFKSPLGGALFTLEVLKLPLTTTAVMVLMVTTVTAAMTAYALSGCTLDIPFDQGIGFDTSLIPFVLLLGVFCGFYSLYYSFIMKKVQQMLDLIKNPWVRNVCGGAMLALLVFLFPTLYGEGYETIGRVINGNFSTLLNDSLFAADSGMWALTLFTGATLMVKCFATAATNGGGGVSGDFAPTLFAGCMAGFFFASLLNELFGLHLPPAHFAYFAMAGVMAGAIRAPLMAIFLTCEMGAAYSYFLPLMLTAAISFGVVRLFTADSFFSRRLDRNNGLIARMNRPRNQAAGNQAPKG